MRITLKERRRFNYFILISLILIQILAIVQLKNYYTLINNQSKFGIEVE